MPNALRIQLQVKQGVQKVQRCDRQNIRTNSWSSNQQHSLENKGQAVALLKKQVTINLLWLHNKISKISNKMSF